MLDRREALRRLKEIAEECGAEREEVLKVILFGSLAEGRAVPGSDADILIILRRSERDFHDRTREYIGFFDQLGMPVEILAYTEEEFRHLVEGGNRFLKRALERGITLFER